MSLGVSFPGNKRLDVSFNGFEVQTGQPLPSGGEASAPPEPFDLYLTVLGCCADRCALNFCPSRQMDNDGLELMLDWQSPALAGETAGMRFPLRRPHEFPDILRECIVRPVDPCTVKCYVYAPPRDQIVLESCGSPITA